MATQIQNKSASQVAAPAVSRADQYLDKQLTKTTQQVRVADIVTGIISVAVYILAFFMIAALIDAWVWAFTPTARLVLLGGFMIGLAVIAWRYILPFFVRRINPQYAAKMIEEAKPEFKNSLVNYLFLRNEKKATHRAILNEVSRKAATDISKISPDAAVDKSNLITIGFVLVALAAAAVCYSILSPKNPWPTVLRILSPGSKISKPAAVLISDVEPGDTSVFFGEKLNVTARISGATDDEAVQLVYSSKDEQIVDAVVPMEKTDGTGLYSAVLDTGPAGIQQSLSYHIEAGDGISAVYSINVRPNPTISIEQVKVTPPKYTQLAERIIEGNGEIQAVEGSKVEITAKANLPIQLAYIVPLIAKDFDSPTPGYREMRTIQMRTEKTTAVGRIVAALNSNRDRAQFTHYKINFRSVDDHRNERPNVYPIRVVADLAPEIQIVQPPVTEITSPSNQALPIQIWAADLDYEISSIDLQIDHQGRKLLGQNLFRREKPQQPGERISTQTQITPKELGLKPGDQAILFATAADNRVSTNSGLPDPNITRTENYKLIITDPVKEETTSTDQNDNTDKSESSSADSQDEQSDQSQSEPSDQNGEQNSDEQSSGSETAEPNSENGESGSDSSEQNDENGNESTNSQEQSSDSRSESGNSQSGDSGSDRRDQNNSSGSEQQDDTNSGNDQNPNGQNKSGDQANNQQENATGGKDPTGDDQQSASDNPSDSQSSSNGGGKQDESGQPSEQGKSGGSNSQPSDGNENTNGQQKPGNEGGLQDGDPNDQSDGNSGSDNGLKRDAANASNQDRQGQPGTGNDGSGGDNDGVRDENLQSGNVEPLRENAPEGDQVERLKEYVDKQNEKRESGKSQNTGRQNANPNDRQNSANQSAVDGNSESETDDENGNQGQGSESQERSGNGNQEATSDRSQTSSNSQKKDDQSSTEPSSSENGSSQPQGDIQNANPSAENQEQSGGAEGSENKSNEGSKNGSEPSDSESSAPSNEQTSPTSQPQQPGGASKQSEGSESSQSNQNPKGSSAKPAGENGSSDSSSSSKPSEGEPGNENASTAGGKNQDTGNQTGSGSTNAASDSSEEMPPPNPDQADLDYAKKVTDLILEELENQKYDPDPELLEQMNWTQQDLDDFIKRWQAMKQAAQANDTKAKRNYEDSLRALGLSPTTKSRVINAKKDNKFKLNEDGAIDQVPAEYLEQFNNFLKRRNRSRRNRD